MIRRALVKEVSAELDLGCQLLPRSDKKLFRKSRSKLLKSKSQYLEAWLNRVRAARAMVEAGVTELPRVSRRKASTSRVAPRSVPFDTVCPSSHSTCPKSTSDFSHTTTAQSSRSQQNYADVANANLQQQRRMMRQFFRQDTS
jgi:hypothetical protein